MSWRSCERLVTVGFDDLERMVELPIFSRSLANKVTAHPGSSFHAQASTNVIQTPSPPEYLQRMSDLSVVDDDTATISSTHTSDSHSFTRPAPTKVMSNHAEEELLDLATNFLLYVAMVIIVVMVARIYWPHLLVRGTPSPPFAKGNEGGG